MIVTFGVPCFHILLKIYQLVPDTTIRITGVLEGRVEIFYQGIWGTICNDGWDDADATVVCRDLGLLGGTAIRQAQYGLSTGPIWLSQVGCLGNENKLSYCNHNGAGIIGNCSNAQDAGVKCRPKCK